MPADVTPEFSGLISALQRYNQHLADGLAGVAGGQWFLSCFDPPLAVDEDEIHERLNRIAPGNVARQAHTGPAGSETTANLVGAVMQGGYLGGWERELRSRLRPRLRLIAHQLARGRVHAHDRGPIAGGPLRQVKQVFEHGNAEGVLT